MSKRITVEVKYEDGDGNRVIITGNVGRWDGTLHTLPASAAKAVENALASSMVSVDTYRKRIHDLETQLAGTKVLTEDTGIAPAAKKAAKLK